MSGLARRYDYLKLGPKWADAHPWSWLVSAVAIRRVSPKEIGEGRESIVVETMAGWRITFSRKATKR